MTASQNSSTARGTGVHFYQFVAALAFAVVFGIFSGSLDVNAAEAAAARRPNFLMIMCDQLNTFTMGVAGCDVKTPNIDRLANEGTWFKNAVCAYPLCVPSRISMAVGVYPHQRDYFGNNGGGRSPEVREKFARLNEDHPLLWQYFSKAGYRCGYAGKWHVPVDPDDPEQSGFEHFGAGSMTKQTEEMATRIRRHSANEPFFYRMFTEGLDRYVGQLVDAVADSPQSDNTIIVFISDHGDGAAAHHWNQKTALWEECIRVPFIIRAPGGPKGVVNEHPVSSGIDLIPTLLELADLEVPDYLPGQSLRPIIEQKQDALREYSVTETAIGRTQGRCLRTARYKYVVYGRGADSEQFFDLQADPGEMKNLIGDAGFADAIVQHRDLLHSWCRQTDDDFKMPQ